MFFNDNENLQVLLAGVASPALQYRISYTDVEVSDFSAVDGGADSGTFSTTSATSLLGSPGSGEFRKINTLNIFNADNVTHTVTLQIGASGSYETVWYGALDPNEKLFYSEARGFQVLDSSGLVKTPEVAALGDSVVDEITFDQASTPGVSSSASRSDHSHGTPPNPIDPVTIDLLPDTDDALDLGSASLRWQDLYLGPGSLKVMATSGAANPTTEVGSGSIAFGAGAGSAVDVVLSRSGADVLSLADGDTWSVRTGIQLRQTTANYTLTWANPAAGRAISITDPGGSDSFVWLAATQTLTNKTLTSPTINGGSITGITDLAVADGGTGASTAAAARVNLLPSFTGNAGKGLVVNVGETDAEWATLAAGIEDGSYGDIEVTSSGTVWTIANEAVTLEKLQEISEGSILGRHSSGTGEVEEILVQSPLIISAGNLDFDETALLDNTARVAITKNSGAVVGTRRGINFIEGDHISLTITDDGGDEQVDVEIDVTNVANATHASTHESGGPDEISIDGLTGRSATSQLIEVEEDGTPKGERPGINFVSGTDIQVTVTAPGGAGTPFDVEIEYTGVGGGGGSGDVVGPASATDHAVARFDTGTGKLLQDSIVTISDAGAIAGATTLNGITIPATGGTFAKLSDIPSSYTTGKALALQSGNVFV